MKKLIVIAVAGSVSTGFAQGQQPEQQPVRREAPSAVSGGAGGPQPLQQGPQGASGAYQQSGGSLFRMENGGATNAQVSLFAVPKPDPKRIKKFDLLTVIVREESDSQTKSSTDTKKTADFNAILEQYFKLSGLAIKGNEPLANQPQLRFNMERNFKGEGSVDRSDSMSARVQAEVIDVKPNGILILQATKQIKMDEEELKFTLTGMVRAEDVSIDNSVLSTQLADLQLEKATRGAARDASKRGWVVKFFDALNPF